MLNIYDLDRDLNKGDFGLHQKRNSIGLGLGLWCLMPLSTMAPTVICMNMINWLC